MGSTDSQSVLVGSAVVVSGYDSGGKDIDGLTFKVAGFTESGNVIVHSENEKLNRENFYVKKSQLKETSPRST